jgi:HSP20 family protein
MMRMIRNYNSLQDALLNDFFGKNISDFIGNDAISTNPLVNITENAEGFQIHLAAPGLDKANFEITVEKNQLTIRSHKETQVLEEGARYNRRAFDFSTFSRSFNLPETIDIENVSATCENGILRVILPKKTEVIVVPKNIEVM